MITVDYPSNKLIKTIDRCIANIKTKYILEKERIENSHKSKSRFMIWLTESPVDSLDYLEQSKNWKLNTARELKLAAESGDYVRMSMDTLKWLDYHDHNNEFGW